MPKVKKLIPKMAAVKVGVQRASTLFDKDPRTIRRWCESGTLLASRTHSRGAWEILIPRQTYNRRVEILKLTK